MNVALMSRINRFGKGLVSLISVLGKFIGKQYRPTLASLLKNKRSVLEK